MGDVELRVYAELNDFLAPELRGAMMRRPAQPHQTVKDIIEAAGIPHTEVDLVLVDGRSVGFDERPEPGDRIAAYPVFETLDIGPIARVRPAPLRHPRFAVDVNLGGLVRLLWLMGLDARWDGDVDDDEQAVEVLGRLDLADRTAPFSRCLRCGGTLAEVTKDEVLDQLEPLTRQYYDDFRRCETCAQV